jgi:hypothetical protein
MPFAAIVSPSRWQLGFLGSLLFYALGLGLAASLAQVMPVADMRSPGVPVMAGPATILLGAFGLVAACVAVLLGCRGGFVKGMMVMHSLILVGVIDLILALTRGA